MSDYRKLSKVTSNIYFVMFGVSLLFMLINTAFILRDYGIISTGGNIAARITAEINKVYLEGGVYDVPKTGLDLSSVFIDKYNVASPGYSFGFVLTMIGIFVMLFVRELSFMDIRTREFEHTFPVKRLSLVIHEYLSFFVIILSVTLTQGILLTLFQNHYNSVWSRLLRNEVGTEFINIPMGNLWTMVIIYSVILLIAYTWMFLGMTLAKNSVAFGVISIITFFAARYAFEPVADTVMSLILGRSPGIDPNGVPYDKLAFVAWEKKRDMLDGIYECICDIFLPGQNNFTSIELKGFFDGNIGDVFGYSLESSFKLSLFAYLVIYLAILTLLILILVMTVRNRKLSKGKIFYFRWTDVIFAIACGIMWYSFVYNWLWIYEYSFNILISAIVVSVIVYYFISPERHVNKSNYHLDVRKNADKRQNISEVGKLLKYEWKKYLTLIIIGLLSVIGNLHLTNKDYLYNWTLSKDINDYISYAPSVVVDLFENCAEIIGEMFLRNLICIMVLIVIGRLALYFREKNGSVREFRESIPVSRAAEFKFHVIMDMIVIIIPMAAFTIIETCIFKNYFTDNGISMRWFGSSIFGIFLTCITYLLMLEALILLVEQMLPNGMMRLIGIFGTLLMIYVCGTYLFNVFYLIPVAQVIYGIFSLRITGGNHYDVKAIYNGYLNQMQNGFIHGKLDVPVIFNGESFNDMLADNMNYKGFEPGFSRLYDFSHPSSYIGCVLLYIALAVLLVTLAYKCCINKDHSRQGLYFTFEKYLLSGMISFTVFCILAALSVSIWHVLMILIMAVILYVVLVKLMTPKNSIVVIADDAELN